MNKIKQQLSLLKSSPTLMNVILSLSSKAVAMLLFLTTDILIARLLSKQLYGEWSFYYAIVSIGFWIGWFGINSSAKVFVAKARHNRLHTQQYVGSAILLRLIVSILLLISMFLLAKPLSHALGYPSKFPQLLQLLYIAPFMIFFNSFFDLFKELSIGTVDFKKVFILTLVEFGGYLLFGVGLLAIFRSVNALAIGYLASLLAGALLGFLMFLPQLKDTHTQCINKTFMNQIFAYAVPLLAISIGSAFMTEMDKLIIGIMLEPSDVAVFSIAKNLILKLTHIATAIAVGVMTEYAIITPNNAEKKRKHFVQINLLVLLGLLFISLIIILAGPFAIQILYGEQYKDVSMVLNILLIYFIFFSLNVFTSLFMDYQNKAKERALYIFLLILCNLGLEYFLIPIYGTLGAALATSLSIIPYTILQYISIFRVFASYIKKAKPLE